MPMDLLANLNSYWQVAFISASTGSSSSSDYFEANSGYTQFHNIFLLHSYLISIF